VTAHHLLPLDWVALACAAAAALILLGYLVFRPPLGGATRVWLLFGLGVLPIGAALSGNFEGFRMTKQRTFCGSCHVMTPHALDASNLTSTSLASRHSRNALFGEESCYVCHTDYGMFGTVTTKLGGMKHVWKYYTEYRHMPLEEAKTRIHLYKPYSNNNCMQCHSTTLDLWQRVPDHKASLDDVRTSRVSCASAGCHGFAHPFTKRPGADAAAAGVRR
jgi:cytochrome c-type protein NapC